jgi:hypothetical protein
MSSAVLRYACEVRSYKPRVDERGSGEHGAGEHRFGEECAAEERESRARRLASEDRERDSCRLGGYICTIQTEHGACEERVHGRCLGEIRLAEVRAGEVRASEVGVCELRATEVRAGEIRTGEVDGLLVLGGVSAADDGECCLDVRTCRAFGRLSTLFFGWLRPLLAGMLADARRQDLHDRRVISRGVVGDAL